jgi:hypothetical protein
MKYCVTDLSRKGFVFSGDIKRGIEETILLLKIQTNISKIYNHNKNRNIADSNKTSVICSLYQKNW